MAIVLALVPAAVSSGLTLHCDLKPAVEHAKIDPQEVKCLATMVYGEARGEPVKGQIAVAYTAVNRATKKTVCKVVLAPYQYSIFNDNPALRAAALSLDIEPKQKNPIDRDSWQNAMKVALMVLHKEVPDPTKGSTHYLAPKVMASKKFTYPKWSRVYTHTTTIENHKFFKPAKITKL